MAGANVHVHPAVERMALRRRMTEAVERLLDTVDVLLFELAEDEPDADLEPSLGATEHPAHLSKGGGWQMPARIFAWSKGCTDDREADGDHNDIGVDADREPSLGSSPGINQRFWANGGHRDYEQEHDGREPSLGSVAVAAWSDQRHWAEGGDEGEREAEDDAEPDQDGDGTANPQWQITGRLMTEVDGPDAWRPIDPDNDPGEAVLRCEVGLS